MRLYWNTIRFGIVLLAFLLLYTLPLSAYVLQGPHVLDLMMKKLGTANHQAVSTRLIIYDQSHNVPPVELLQNLKISRSSGIRVEIPQENSESIRVRSYGNSVTVLNGRVVPSRISIFDTYLDLLSARSRQMLQSRLMDLGIDLGVTSIGRHEDKIVFVIGAGYPDMTVPQIWIDKETFLPVRWISIKSDQENNVDTIDVLYMDWRRESDVWWPWQIDFIKDRSLVRRIEIFKVEPNVRISEAQFDVDQIRSAFPAMVFGRHLPAEFNPFEAVDGFYKDRTDGRKEAVIDHQSSGIILPESIDP